MVRDGFDFYLHRHTQFRDDELRRFGNWNAKREWLQRFNGRLARGGYCLDQREYIRVSDVLQFRRANNDSR